MDKQKVRNGVIIALIVLQVALLLMNFFVVHKVQLLAGLFLVVQIGVIIVFFRTAKSGITHKLNAIEETVAPSYLEALHNAKTGILFYDDFYVITWMSDYLEQQGYSNRIGHKLLEWLPEVDELLKGDSDSVVVNLDEHFFIIEKSRDGQVLFLKDETNEVIFKDKSTFEQPVVGMINIDNFDESTRYEDEYVAAQVNGTIRTGIINWCKQHQIVCKRIRNDRYYLIMNYRSYRKMADNDRFSILKQVREQALELDLMITLSMSFAYGSNDLSLLDDYVVNGMELAQSRGGDQVAIKQDGKDVIFFGGNSEASEKRSRVRARVMAHALRDMISRCSNVILVGHKEADFDCVGALLGLSSIANSLNKRNSIVLKSGGIESKVNAFIEDNQAYFDEQFHFITESQAINELEKDTLVIMTDHNSMMQCNAANMVKQANKVIIIDHHRRPEDLIIQPMMVYIEPGCSSTSEMVTEFFSYMGHQIQVDSMVATIMYAGIIVDTQRFKNRSGQRTFDAASKLLDLRADSVLVDQLLKDSYKEFEAKINWLNQTVQLFPGYYLIMQDIVTTRSFMSQIADDLMDIDNAKAVFVMAKLDDKQIGISARSGGEVNVQVIMEDLKGGGHRTAAASQRSDVNMVQLRQELVEAIERRINEVNS